MQYGDILFEKMDKIVVLTLNRPELRNAITGEGMIREIEEACSIVQEDEEVCALILTGAGSAFSAGGNVKDMQAREGMFAGDLSGRTGRSSVAPGQPRGGRPPCRC